MSKEVKVLDQGYVILEAHCGNDLSIVNAARASFKKHHDVLTDADVKLIEFLMRNKHCYDQETEVLTDNGFKLWSDIAKTTKLGCWDPINRTLVYETPIDVINQDYKGLMYKVEHGGVDLLVTPEHKMWVKTKVWNKAKNNNDWSSDYTLKTAKELDAKSMVRYSKLAPYLHNRNYYVDGVNCQASLLKLYGFFIGDGYASDIQFSISFHLKKLRKINYLKDLCDKIGASYSFNEKNNQFYIHKADWNKNFRQMFYDEDGQKKLPSALTVLNQEDSLNVIDGLKNSDGSLKRSAWEYSTTSNILAQQIQILALHAGEVVHVNSSATTKYKAGTFSRLMFMSRMKEPVINQTTQNTSWQEYNGKVYCAHTRTGILVVRRNGKIVLSGNSTPFEMVDFTFRIKAPKPVVAEWQRHRFSSFNEASQRYVEFANEFYTPANEALRTQVGKPGNYSFEPITDTDTAETIQYILKETYDYTYQKYQDLLKLGLAKEVARNVLSFGFYTEFFYKANLRSIFNFLSLRNDERALFEIREYAKVIEQFVAEVVPVAYAAFIDNGRVAI